MIKNVSGRGRIAILGFGFEGRALFFYLKKKGHRDITILDRNGKIRPPRGAKSVLGKNYLKGLSRFDVVYRSPGIPYNLPEIQKIKNKVSGLSELFFSRAPGKIIGITGSSGKTTTATLLYKILKSSGKKVYLAGNIGINPFSILDKLSARSLIVMELSSFQLQDLKHSPHIAVILDIYEEHLDKHKTFSEYLKAKTNIVKFQKKNDFAIYSRDNKFSKKIGESSRGGKMTFSVRNSSADIFIKNGFIRHRTNGNILKINEIKLRGPHNYKNIMAASLAALYLGASKSVIKKIVSGFRGIEHRLEFVRRVGGVEFYDDSKATNIHSAIAGMDAFSAPKIVLIGGQNKNLNFVPLARRLSRPDVKRVILFGRARLEIARVLRRLNFSGFDAARGLQEAVGLAWERAESGDVVLLSPAAASFDEFGDYKERGKKFKEWVLGLRPK